MKRARPSPADERQPSGTTGADADRPLLARSAGGEDRGGERWRRLQEVFANAVALEGEEQRRYVREACAGDAALEREVEALVDAERSSAGDRFLVRAIRAAAEGLESGEVGLEGGAG